MASRRTWLCFFAPVALALSLAACLLLRETRVSTSLYDMIGEQADRIPGFVREQAAREVAVIVSSKDAGIAKATAERLRRDFKTQGTIPEGAVDFLREQRAGLVSPEASKLLETREGRAKIARRALRRFFSTPIPPLLGWTDDPFLLTEGFLATLPFGRTQVVTNGVTHILLKTTELPAIPEDLSGEVSVALCGASVHAALATERCKREINALTVFSIAFIAVLSLVAFHSFKWLPFVVSSLLVSSLAGAIALCLCFSQIHMVSLVFGTTVLGLVIDYSYHWLLADPVKAEETRKNLILSFLTTAISLLPLMISSIPPLRQAAVFLGTGLAFALLLVVLSYPRNAQPWQKRVKATDFKPPRIGARIVGFSLLAISVIGLMRAELKTDVTSVYRPPPELLRNERLRAMFGSFDFSSFPSLDERMRLADSVRILYEEQAQTLCREGIAQKLVPPPNPTFGFVRPKDLLDSLFSDWTRSTLRWLCISLSVMFAILLAFFRCSAIRVFTPSLAALLVVGGLLSLVGVKLNLFHLLSGFLLAGMGVDYTIFLHSGERTALRSVTCSLLTSVAGFGALVFVSLPIAASFGQVLGLGLPIAFLFAIALMPPTTGDVEQAASSLGMEALWLVYRLCGLRVLHFLSSIVGCVSWLFSPSIRKGAPSPAKVICFTRALADKMVVMADGSSQPSVSTDDSPDAMQFVDDVRLGRGVFVLSSHVGTIEALVALGSCGHSFHAWMDVDRTGVFTRFYLKHARRERVVIHPISDFGMSAVFEAGTLLDGGDCVLMAGDRGDGAFRFAAAFDHPVYFVACLAKRHCRYQAFVRRLPTKRRAMKIAYDAIFQDLIRRYPEQHFNWA